MDGNEVLNMVVSREEDIYKVASAMSTPLKLSILQACRNRLYSITELADLLSVPQATITTNVRSLEDSGLLQCTSGNGKHGRQKLCKTVFTQVTLSLPDQVISDKRYYEVDMPVGLYTRFHVEPPCGLLSRKGYIGMLDTPDIFMHPDRAIAGILWFERGWVEYSYPKPPDNKKIESLEVSVELCSEAIGYNMEWPSDISFWINDRKIGTWTCPSDFGGIRGKYSPEWLDIGFSQYGQLKTWTVDTTGCYLDGEKISDLVIDSLGLDDVMGIWVRIGIDDDAVHSGGINIFGKGFGNCDQGILLRLRTGD